MANLLETFRNEAVERGLSAADQPVSLAGVFALVRDMPYQRSSDRQPQTLVREWRGTCSGKHYLLQALFAEMGYASTVMACTTESPISGDRLSPELRPLWEQAGGRFMDVHNFLVLHLPEGDMVVDATWPLDAARYGLVSNAEFVPGKDQQIALQPLQTWAVPPDRSPQDFKEELLHKFYSPAELAFRDAYIVALGDWFRHATETG